MPNMISLAALDKFATDHSLHQERCTELAQPISFSNPPKDAEVSVAISNIRTLVLDGYVDQATDIVNFLCPDALNDPELQIEIRIHKLFELIHRTRVTLKEDPRSYQNAVQRALDVSKDLAHFALHAFPDAYTKFTESMMLFAYPDQDVSDSKLMKRRDILAGNMTSLVRMTVGTRDSSLSLLIRYLIVIYLQSESTLNPTTDTIGNEANIMYDLLPRRKSDQENLEEISWSVDDVSFLKSRSSEDYSIAEIQSLRERLSISREQSVLSLQYAKGDTFVALRNELGRLKFDSGLFEHLVTDYRAARGLSSLEASRTNQVDRTDVLTNYSSIDAGENLGSSNVTRSSPRMGTCMRKLRTFAKQAGSCDVDSIRRLLPKTSSQLNFRLALRECLCLLQNDEVDKSICNCRDKMGPLAQDCQEFLPLVSDVLLLAVYARDCHRIRTTDDSGSSGFGIDVSMDPVDKIDQGKIGSRQWKSAASKCPAFDSAIADAHARVNRHSSIDGILGDAYELLEKEFGEPQLVKLLKRLLEAHKEWQSRNLIQDRFSEKLGIDKLRLGLSEGQASNHTDVNTHSTVESKGVEARPSEHAPSIQYEDTIVALMEFLAMTRTEALSAVRNHPLASDPQAMVNFVLGSMM